MMQRRKEIQVGVCVLLSTLVFVFGLLWFKQFRFAGSMVRYQVEFPAVDGLQVSDRVQVRGMRMGKVMGFDMAGDVVRVTVLLDRTITLRDDAQFRLATVGIVGEKIVEVSPGKGGAVKPGHVFQGIAEPSLTAMTATAGETMAGLNALMGDLRVLVQELQREGRLAGTVDAARSTLQNVDGVLGENRQDLRVLVKELRTSATALREAVTAPDSGAAGTLAQASRTLARSDSTLALVERTADSLLSLMTRLEAGQGTAGKLLTDDRLYEETTQTLSEVRELLKDFRRNPKRYFRFNVIDF
jgi:phospholipid/cholesterol/gamma-HCH transport system substrate-binding protein